MKNFLSPLKKYLPSRQKKIVKKEMTNPRRDWTLVLLLIAFLGLSAGAFSYYSFVTYYAIDQQNVEVSVKTLHYQGPQIREQVAGFSEMKERFEALTTNSNPIPPTTASSTLEASTNADEIETTETEERDEVPSAAI